MNGNIAQGLVFPDDPLGNGKSTTQSCCCSKSEQCPRAAVSLVTTSGSNEDLCEGRPRCCYEGKLPDQSQCEEIEVLTEGCSANIPKGAGKKCGLRIFEPDANAVSAGEFPWSCIVYKDNGGFQFVASCVIIPQQTDNDISKGTSMVITVAHRIVE